MASYNPTNGIISARVIQVSKGGDQVRLALLNTGKKNALGMQAPDVDGWHQWDPAMVPAKGDVLDIPCKSASSTDFPTINEETGAVGIFTKLAFEFV